MRELRKSNDRMLFGVAAGFAEYFQMDTVLWRVIWVVGCIAFPPFFLAYLILGMALPSATYRPGPTGAQQAYTGYSQPGTEHGQQAYTGQGQPGAEHGQQAYSSQSQPRPSKRLIKSRDRWLAGVAGGVAEYLDLDPVLVRLLFLASLFVGGTGLLIYVVLAVVMPRPDYSYNYYQVR